MNAGAIRRERESQPNELLPDLRGWQIFFILASVIIGEGIFSGDREALEVAGPGGTLVALFLVGALAICVMSCVSELVQLFPVPNAIVEYIKAFVDEDLAWCCGIAYWYTWTSVFVALYYVAVNFTQYWGLPQLWHNVIFGVAPVAIFAINMLGVNMFGIVETIGGFLKLLLVIGVGIAMYVIHSLPPAANEPSPLYDGFEADPAFVTSPVAGVFWVIPTMAYSFLGVESVCITAFEARDVHSLRNPSRWIAWVILFIYAFTLIAEFLVFSWMDPNLPAIYGADKGSIPLAANSGKLAMAVVALDYAGHWNLASFINAGCVFSALSASNAALYVASRTLYGLARNTPEKRTPMSRIFKKFSHTTDNTRVPALALFVSMIAFVWLPFLTNIQNGDTVQLVFDILSGTASVMCLIVWAALCASLLRFRRWYALCRDGLEEGYERYDRQRTSVIVTPHTHTHSRAFSHTHAGTDDATASLHSISTTSSGGEPSVYGARTGLMFLQPGLAWIGMLGSTLVVLVLSTGTWWNHEFTGQKFAIAYTAPLCIMVLWPLRKLWARAMHDKRSGWVHLSADPVPLMDTLNALQCAIPEKQVRGWDDFVAQHPWLAPLERAVRRRRGDGDDGEDGGAGGGQAVGGHVTGGQPQMAGGHTALRGLFSRRRPNAGAYGSPPGATFGTTTQDTPPYGPPHGHGETQMAEVAVPPLPQAHHRNGHGNGIGNGHGKARQAAHMYVHELQPSPEPSSSRLQSRDSPGRDSGHSRQSEVFSGSTALGPEGEEDEEGYADG